MPLRERTPAGPRSPTPRPAPPSESPLRRRAPSPDRRALLSSLRRGPAAMAGGPYGRSVGPGAFKRRRAGGVRRRRCWRRGLDPPLARIPSRRAHPLFLGRAWRGKDERESPRPGPGRGEGARGRPGCPGRGEAAGQGGRSRGGRGGGAFALWYIPQPTPPIRPRRTALPAAAVVWAGPPRTRKRAAVGVGARRAGPGAGCEAPPPPCPPARSQPAPEEEEEEPREERQQR